MNKNEPKIIDSLDDAVRLIPAGHWWTVGQNAGGADMTRDLFRASVYPKDQWGAALFVLDSSPARALWRAAIRARADIVSE